LRERGVARARGRNIACALRLDHRARAFGQLREVGLRVDEREPDRGAVGARIGGERIREVRARSLGKLLALREPAEDDLAARGIELAGQPLRAPRALVRVQAPRELREVDGRGVGDERIVLGDRGLEPGPRALLRRPIRGREHVAVVAVGARSGRERAHAVVVERELGQHVLGAVDAGCREIARRARDRLRRGGRHVERRVRADHHDRAALGSVDLDVREFVRLGREQRAQAVGVDERCADPLHEHAPGRSREWTSAKNSRV